MKSAIALLPIILLCSACLTGNNYPDQYADAYCGTLYYCFEADSVEDANGWDGVSDCEEEIEGSISGSASYDAYQEGDLVFNADAAKACINEIEEFLADPDCAGDDLGFFSGLNFLADVTHEDCASVYVEED